MTSNSSVISCPVALVLYREGKEDRSWKKEEALREGKTINGARYFPNFIHAPIPTDMT
ncbi:hypothetical protein [Okeania sp. SIO1I7]|uniref:hypothetical protein n=1 Tax=Okeania sp. SIO1I7 TaxID=2607772 RepID=UPI0013F7C387|nr:hypothetical protein [Okeania sp. SIO1I7]NET26298.1 hypothetical protein [Okeania sp. SIO1I7]